MCVCVGRKRDTYTRDEDIFMDMCIYREMHVYTYIKGTYGD